jgi:hypothetical protein
MFKEQSESAQEKMISAYDKSLGITANKNVQKFVQSIRQTIRDRKKGMQDVKAAQNEFRKLMSSLPKDVKATPQVKKLVSIVSRHHRGQHHTLNGEGDGRCERDKGKGGDC